MRHFFSIRAPMVVRDQQHKQDTSLSSTWHKSLYRQKIRWCMLLWLLSVSIGHASPLHRIRWDNAALGIDVGFGPSYKSVLPGRFLTKKLPKSARYNMHVPLNMRFGIKCGYGFSLGRKIKLGPELGCSIGTPQKLSCRVRIDSSAMDEMLSGILEGPLTYLIEYQESYVVAPIGIRLDIAEKSDRFIVRGGGIAIGYELGYLLSNRHNVSRISGTYLTKNDITNIEAVLNKLASSSRKRVNFVLAGHLNLPNGCYCSGKIKVPILDLLKVIELHDEVKNNEWQNVLQNRLILSKVLDAGLTLTRILTTTCAEYSIGVNLLSWLN